MMWRDGDWNWAAWTAMTITMLHFWALVIGGVTAVARGAGSRGVKHRSDAQ